MLRFIVLAAFMAWAAPAAAQDDARQQKIAELVRTIRLQDMFDQQITQSRAAYAASGRKMIAQLLVDGPPIDPAKRTRLEGIYQRYIERGLARWKAEDLAGIWSRHFSKDLSDDDLDQILAFYKSPIGQKVVVANQEANAAYTVEALAQSQAGIQEALKQFAAELQEEMSR